MRDKPDGKDLLEVAELTLKQDILPDLEGDARYQALMIASAMRIAKRQMDGIDAPEQERRDLLDLLACDAGDVLSLNKLLVQKIRQGNIAEGSKEYHKIQVHLLKVAEMKLQISNPGYQKIP